MICVYPADCSDFSNNGLGPVAPQSCTVTETLNGEWELTLVHPIDDLGKWQRLTEGCIIRAPVPAAPTPRVQVSIPEHNDLQDVYSCTVYGYMTITACSAYIQFMCFTLKEGRLVDDPTNDTNPFQVECKFCHYVEFNNVTLDAAGIDYATFSVKASTLFLMAVGIYNTSLGISGYQASCYLSSCFGSCSSWLFYFIGGLVFANGTIPSGSTAAVSAAQYFSSGTSIDYGTATPAVLPDQTSVIKASLTRTYQGGWRSDTLDAVQGVYSDYGYSTSLSWNYGCIWFNTLKTLLSGKTIRSATLTLHRKPGNGSFSARTVYLYAITNTLASGSATIKANFGALGTIGRDQQVTFSIPTSVITGLVSGSYGGICLWEPTYNFGGSSYSENYLRISGTDAADAYIPYLTVVHSG